MISLTTICRVYIWVLAGCLLLACASILISRAAEGECKSQSEVIAPVPGDKTTEPHSVVT